MTTSNTNATLGSQTFNYFCSAESFSDAIKEMNKEQLTALYGYTKGAPSTSIKFVAAMMVKEEVAERTLEVSKEEGEG